MQAIKFLLILFLTSVSIAFSQDMKYAHEVIDTLTSPFMHGRGYVNKGDKIAAGYIENEFKKMNLQPVDENYFQKFSFPVNTFPKKMEVSMDGIQLKPGADFIVDANSSKGKGTYELHWLVSANFRGSLDKIKNKFIVIDKSNVSNKDEQKAMDLWINDPHGAKGVIVVEEKKLTWTVARKKYKYPVIHILKSAIKPDAKSITLRIDEKFRKKHKTQNVIAMIKGTSVPDSFIVFSAHYDHLGQMGKDTYFPGANDNASGTSMMLNLAKHYSQNRPNYSMLFIAFAGEEAGLMGSEYYVKNPLVPLSKIKFLLNMDLLGTGDDGLMVVNGDVYKEQYTLMDTINNQKQYVKSLQKRGKARNSDHYWFSENNVPCFFIYTLGGIAAYHDIYDKAETLPLTDYEDVFKLITDFVSELK
ncbi:MAG TPA: M28 family peptidase [Bacteroidia bacterium]|nr:M28 family peptidase [Bacteroidia bacterium]